MYSNTEINWSKQTPKKERIDKIYEKAIKQLEKKKK